MFEFPIQRFDLRTRSVGVAALSTLLTASALGHTVNESVLPYRGQTSQPTSVRDSAVPGRAEKPVVTADVSSDDGPTNRGDSYIAVQVQFARIPFYIQLMRLW